MATTTKFVAKLMDLYLQEVFGSQNVKEPLVNKGLTQKVKYQLKKLGTSIQEEYKEIIAQMNEIRDKYSEEVFASDDPDKKKPLKRIKEDSKEEFEKEAKELEEMEVEISHYAFTEKDFIDQSTGDVVGGTTYYNLIDKILYEKMEEVVE